MAITKDTPVEELMEVPAAAEVLMMHGLGCAGCSGCGAAAFGTLADVAEAHGLNADKLVKEINLAIDSADDEDDDEDDEELFDDEE